MEKPRFRENTEGHFKFLGVETASEYMPGEEYDFVYIHWTGDSSLVDRIKQEQPDCVTMGYSSLVFRDMSERCANRSVLDKMKPHFDVLIYSETIFEQIKGIVERKKASASQ
ncbi:MAG: hypothetical protein ABIG30_03580 [Candidatus Aenigmatarchaeota archaeon]